MSTIHAAQVLTAHGWRNSVRLTLQSGRIATMQMEAAPEPGDERHAVIVPSLGNLHSHAFQRGMAGFAEAGGERADSFWTWRDVMYRFALRMNPDQFEAIATQAYVEMIEAGFSRVGEFHYLHHSCDGTQYTDIGEMAGRVAAAAQRSGIGLTLLPVFYAHSTFGGVPPKAAQRRFVNTLDAYHDLLQRCRSFTCDLGAAQVGVAPHSLRAVTLEELLAVVKMADSAPVHIHIAEQIAEVDECLAWSGQRPVAWLLENAPVGANWCLVHATHVNAQEIAGVTQAGAVIGVCPLTEANLGDGVLPVCDVLRQHGRLGVGTDSNVHINLAGELCLLEYAQRIQCRARNVIQRNGQSTGRAIIEIVLAGGAQALGAGGGRIASGAPADFVSLNVHHPALCCRHADALLDAWIFASSGNMVDCAWIAGRKLVKEGWHVARDEVQARFKKAIMELCD